MNNEENLSLNILNLNINVEDECMICKEELSCYQCYELPECKHKYHTHCLISWFRNGDSRCPYCGNKGINHSESKCNNYSFRRSRFYSTNTFESVYLNDLRKFANAKKNINNENAINIKKSFNKITNLQELKKNNDDELFDFKKKLKTENVIYGDAKKKINYLRTNSWNISRKINNEKYKLVNNSYIIPLIIPTTIDLT